MFINLLPTQQSHMPFRSVAITTIILINTIWCGKIVPVDLGFFHNTATIPNLRQYRMGVDASQLNLRTASQILSNPENFPIYQIEYNASSKEEVYELAYLHKSDVDPSGDPLYKAFLKYLDENRMEYSRLGFLRIQIAQNKIKIINGLVPSPPWLKKCAVFSVVLVLLAGVAFAIWYFAIRSEKEII